jgi:hypothetical protein
MQTNVEFALSALESQANLLDGMATGDKARRAGSKGGWGVHYNMQ